MIAVDHYHKGSSKLIENVPLNNELRVKSSDRSNHVIDQALSIINDNPTDGVIISACGDHVTKAVGVIEQLRKQNPSILQQSCDLFYFKVEDVWTPDMPGLDTLKVTRRIPSLQMKLVYDKSLKPPSLSSSTSSSNQRGKRKSQDIHT